MDLTAFEQLIVEAMAALPEAFREKLDNVDVVVEEWPDAETLRRAGIQSAHELLGFYHGVPLTRRTRAYNLVLPDKISLYRRPILMRCHSRAEVLALIQHVLRHEVAHHFGLSDEQLRAIGAY